MRFVLTILAAFCAIAACAVANAQCGPGGCAPMGYSYSMPYSYGYAAPSYGMSYGATYGNPTVIGTPVYTQSVVAAPGAELFDMRQVGPGNYAATNRMTGAQWTWANSDGRWVFQGYGAQPAIIEERIVIPQQQAAPVYVQPYRSRTRTTVRVGR